MKHLVVGRGQVGSALIEVLKARYDVRSIDTGTDLPEHWLPVLFDVIHICIPYNTRFDDAVRQYRRLYQAHNGLLIIHSSVAVGTSEKHDAVHSPIRGVHPNLATGILTFTKFFGGARAEEARLIFTGLGIRGAVTKDSRNTEALKLWDTTYYGWNIVFEKAVKEYCDRHHLDFDIVYTRANETYNQGYTNLGMPNVQRPVLEHREGPIGGHCVIPNARILGGDIAECILAVNAGYHKEAA